MILPGALPLVVLSLIGKVKLEIPDKEQPQSIYNQSKKECLTGFDNTHDKISRVSAVHKNSTYNLSCYALCLPT